MLYNRVMISNKLWLHIILNKVPVIENMINILAYILYFAFFSEIKKM